MAGKEGSGLSCHHRTLGAAALLAAIVDGGGPGDHRPSRRKIGLHLALLIPVVLAAWIAVAASACDRAVAALPFGITRIPDRTPGSGGLPYAHG
jgi:hypothetical protein